MDKPPIWTHEEWALELQQQLKAVNAECEHLREMNVKWKTIAFKLRDVASQAMDEWARELK